MKDWKECKLGDVAAPYKKAIISGPFGSNISSKYFTNTGIPVIRGNNLSIQIGIKFKDNDFVFISEEKAKELGTWAEKDDLIFTAAGTIGQVGMLQGNEKYKRYIISNKQLRVTLNKLIVEPLFAYYWFTSPIINETIINSDTGSTIPLINLTVLRSLPILLPPLPEQRAIAAILSSLDDKIDLLHRQNKTLEAMAETLFRQWFVEEADEDWEEKPIGEFVSTVDNRGKTPPNGIIETAYPLIEANALNGESRLIDYSVIKKYVSKETYFNWFRDKLVKYDTVITTVGANIGAMAMYVSERGNIAQNIIGLSTNKISPFYLYQVLKYRKDEIFQLDIGGVQPSLKVPHLLSLEILIPPIDLQKEFDSQVLQFITKMEINSNQIRTLEKLRDNLLPKLMSGEVRVAV